MCLVPEGLLHRERLIGRSRAATAECMARREPSLRAGKIDGFLSRRILTCKRRARDWVMSFKLDPKCDVGGELVRAMREQIADTLTGVGRPRVAAKERIHRARTSTKKLRAAFKLLGAAAPKLARSENRRLRDAARELSDLRDADAMLDCLAALLEHYDPSIQREKFYSVRRSLVAYRRKQQLTAHAAKSSWHEFAAALRATNRALGRCKPDVDFGGVVRALRKCYKRTRDAVRAAEKEPSAESFHEWRKSTKTFAYQCRLLRAAWPPAMKEFHQELRALERRLGDEHDLSLLEARLVKQVRQAKREADSETFGALVGLIHARRQELRSEAILLGKPVLADRPSAVERRIVEWWALAQTAPKGSRVGRRLDRES